MLARTNHKEQDIQFPRKLIGLLKMKTALCKTYKLDLILSNGKCKQYASLRELKDIRYPVVENENASTNMNKENKEIIQRLGISHILYIQLVMYILTWVVCMPPVYT